jgi:hypothetical protein
MKPSLALPARAAVTAAVRIQHAVLSLLSMRKAGDVPGVSLAVAMSPASKQG